MRNLSLPLLLALPLMGQSTTQRSPKPHTRIKVADGPSIAELRAKAMGGDAEAQYNLGLCYANGQGIPRDDTQAMRFFREAAEQGYAAAEHNLGVCYSEGRGIQKDDAEAVRWFRKAADQGVSLAQFNLGICYENGRGISQSYIEAVKWYRMAADHGVAMAQYNLGGDLLPISRPRKVGVLGLKGSRWGSRRAA